MTFSPGAMAARTELTISGAVELPSRNLTRGCAGLPGKILNVDGEDAAAAHEVEE